jgi:hypothetical protein
MSFDSRSGNASVRRVNQKLEDKMLVESLITYYHILFYGVGGINSKHEISPEAEVCKTEQKQILVYMVHHTETFLTIKCLRVITAQQGSPSSILGLAFLR